MFNIFDLKTLLVFATTFLVVHVVGRRRQMEKYPPFLPWLPVVGSLPFTGKVDGWPELFGKKSVILGGVFSFYAGSR